MPVLLTKEFGFEAAHFLPMMPEGHKCRRVHGHSFKIEVNVLGEVGEDGILIDYGDIKRVVKPLVDRLDHWLLNEIGERENIELLKNPTSENLARWIYETLKPDLPGLYSIVVRETCTAQCEYRPVWKE